MIAFSDRRPVTILMASVALCILGVLSWNRLPVQLLPQVVFPEIQINVIQPGAFAEQLEREAVIAVEAEVATVSGVREITTQVTGNAANITVTLEQNVDMKFALVKLQQKMNAVQASLPTGTRVTLERFDTSDFTSFLMQIDVRSTMSLDDTREVAERRVRPRLEQVDGVVNVMVGGGRRSTIEVTLDPDKLEALHIPAERIQEKINAYHRQRAYVGRVIEDQRWVDVNVEGRINDLTDLKALIIEPTTGTRLDQVATIGTSADDRTELYRVNGKSSVGLFIQKDNLSNLLAVSDATLEAVSRLNQELAPEGFDLVVGFNQAEMVRLAIDQLEQHALSGLLLSVAVLFLFLRDVRPVAILATAIPISLLVTANLMYGWNLSVNILSLCGLALAIGMLMDNGVVVLENVFRRFQRGGASREAAVAGTKEMSRSIFASTVTTVLVFLPVLFVESKARLVVRELALSVMFPLVVSLIVAMTVVPLLAGRLLAGRSMRAFGGGRILEIYRTLLKTALRHRLYTIILVAIGFTVSVLAGGLVILSRAPAPPPSRIDVYVTAPRGATLDATDALVRRVEAYIGEFPGIKEYRTNLRPEEAQISIEFAAKDNQVDPAELNRLKDRLVRLNERLTGVTVGFEPPRRTGGQSGSGDNLAGLLSTQKTLRIRGYDMVTLRQISDQLVQTLGTIPEVNRNAVRSDLRAGSPELQVRGDRERLASAGLTMASLMRLLPSTRPEGQRAATPFVTPQGEVDIRLTTLGAENRRPEDIETIRLQGGDGRPLFLREVADVRTDIGESNIVRFNQERQAQITYDFTDQTLQSQPLLERAEAQIAQLVETFRLPEGFSVEQVVPEDETTVYYWMFGIGALLIYLFLAAQFESLLSPLVILGTVPTAIIGALAALMLSGTALSLGEGAPMALLGMIVLLGIVVNNGIILIDRIASLRREDGYRWQRAVLVASQQRVRPIVMTSVTTMVGVLPLAIKQGTELELWPPFAITVFGGLAVSTFSTLIFIPALYVGLEQTSAWLKRIGPLGLVIGSAAAIAELVWLYTEYPSKLYVGLLALPVWFLHCGLLYGIQQYRMVRREKVRLSDRITGIEIRNLTKTYGLSGRFRRDWGKRKRRVVRLVEQGSLPWTQQAVVNSAIWLGAGGLMLAYAHTLITHPFWIVLVSLLTAGWVLGVREGWYAVRFLRGKPPARNRPNRLRRLIAWKWLQQKPEATFDGRSVTPIDFPRRGGLWLLMAVVAYLHFKLAIAGVTAAAAILGLIGFELYRIGRRMEDGRINPEHPAGRLIKLKRAIYTLVRNLPVIRPPKAQITALHGVSLSFGSGMFGLLGPNGAGKTTLMRILVGVLEESRGSIFINGRKLDEQREVFHGAIGYLPQGFGLYENMTAYAYLENHALLNGIYETAVRQNLIEDILNGVGLWERRNDLIRTFSGGMKQRVGIAQTLLHLPQIIVVDEPTVGLDPRERIRFRNLLGELARDRIVVFSTHIVEDIASTCHDLAVLVDGAVLYRGSPEELIRRAEGKVFEALAPEEEFDFWRQRLHVVNHSKVDGAVRFRYVVEEEDTDVTKGLMGRPTLPTLEDAYVNLLRGKLTAVELLPTETTGTP